MVDIRTSQVSPLARGPGQVSRATSTGLSELGSAAQGVADKYSAMKEREAEIKNDLILANVQNDWERTIAEEGREAGSGFTKDIVERYDAYVAEAMTHAPERGRDVLKANLEKYKLRLEDNALKAEAAARARAKAQAQADAMRLKQNMLLTSPDMLPEALEGVEDRASRAALISTALGTVAATDPERVLEEVHSGKYDETLSPSQKSGLINSAEAARASLEPRMAAVSKQERKELEAELAGNIARATEFGDFTNPISDDQIDNVLEPDDAEAFKALRDRKYELARMQYDMRGKTIDQIRDDYALMLLDAEAPGNDAVDMENLQAIRQAMAAHFSALQDDPAAYVINGDIALRLDAASMSEQDDPEVRGRIFSFMAANMDSSYDAMGIPEGQRRYLPKQQAQSIVSGLNEANGGAVAPQVETLKATYGDKYPSVMAQLRAEGLSADVAEYSRHSGDIIVADYLDRIRGVPDKDLRDGLPSAVKPDDVSIAVNDVLFDYAQVITAGKSGAATTDMAGRRKVLERIVMDRVARTGDSPPSVAESVFKRMFPEEVYRGDKVLAVLPVGVSSNEVEASAKHFLETISERSDELYVDDPMLPDVADKPVFDAAMADRGVWIGTGAGMVLTYDVGNGAYAVIEDRNGTPVRMEYDRLLAVPPGKKAKADVEDPQSPDKWRDVTPNDILLEGG